MTGFQLRPEDVHLETRHDRQGKETGTGLAFVQFSSPDHADEARHTKHKQMMGTRYIECMTFIAGMHINDNILPECHNHRQRLV